MKHLRWQILLGLALVLLSALFYFIHYLIFHDPHHIFIYLVGDIAFVPIEVLLVTLIIHRLLESSEKGKRLEKLRMVIGVFFSEVGTTLLAGFSDRDPDLEAVKKELVIRAEWTDRDFLDVAKRMKGHDYSVDVGRMDLTALHVFLSSKRDFLVGLLENPTLHEHESFTEALRAVFHLTEELAGRKTLEDLPEADLAHIGGDIKRAYGQLVGEWLDYMKHMKANYPYLFSLAMRTNPFDDDASPLVT